MFDSSKTYKTMSGRRYRNYCVNGGGLYPIHGAIEFKLNEWILVRHSWELRSDSLSELDLIEVSPYDDFKIDDPVMVRINSNSTRWERRYFAGVSTDGLPMAFNEGATSWSAQDRSTIWCECRRPTPEELNGKDPT
jgi:hypothetical protein